MTETSCLLGISGGADSTALMHGLARTSNRLGLRLEVACLDHGLRVAAGAEVEAVRAQAEGLGLPFHTERLTLPAGGVEAAAREARYAALQRLRAERGLALIATAHTANDQAETVLMRLARGTSLAGAQGVLEARADGVVRPLLFATRAEVEAFVGALGLAVSQDPMNDDRAFLRVRVRTEVLPVFEREAGPGVVRALSRFASLAAEDEACLNGQAQSALGRLALAGGSLDAVGVRALERPIRRRVMARFLEEQGVAIDAATIDEALVALEERRAGTLPGDRLLTTHDERVRVQPAPPRTLHASSHLGQGRGVD